MQSEESGRLELTHNRRPVLLVRHPRMQRGQDRHQHCENEDRLNESDDGAVMEITTRFPEKLAASLQQIMTWQSFSQYGPADSYRTTQTAASVGNRVGRFSFWASGNYQESR